MYGQVEQVERLSPHLVRVVFGGPGLDGFTPAAHTDSYVNLQFPPAAAPYAVPFDDDAVRALPREQRPAGRRYTIRWWEEATRRLAVDFVVHGDSGVAGPWALAARPGDVLQFRGPSGAYSPDPAAEWHLMIGDESALPAIAASLAAVPAGVPVHVLLEVDGPDDELPLASPGDLHVLWVHRGPDVADGKEPLLDAVVALEFPPGRVHAFVHGEAVANRALRTHLLGERGLPREALSVSPYWRRDFTDERWREVKRDWIAAVEHDV